MCNAFASISNIPISPKRYFKNSISKCVQTMNVLFAAATSASSPVPVWSVFVWRCCARLQHLPHHERGPALPGRAVRRRQWVLPEPTQRHPERRHFLRLRRSVCAPRVLMVELLFSSSSGEERWPFVSSECGKIVAFNGKARDFHADANSRSS